uniref:Putative secreted protein n=1 Tax=Anopheles darlingi TaxID=43151 RepID=A0A2M4DRK0_ANODA
MLCVDGYSSCSRWLLSILLVRFAIRDRGEHGRTLETDQILAAVVCHPKGFQIDVHQRIVRIEGPYRARYLPISTLHDDRKLLLLLLRS